MAYEGPNHTQIPNLFLDLQMPKIKSLSELKVVLCIMRKTFGWHKESDRLSLSQIMKLTGLSRPSAIDGIQKAILHKIIEREEEGNSYSYSLRVKDLNQSENFTSKESLPEVVKDLDQEVVKDLNPQKKRERKKEIPLGEASSAKEEGSRIERDPVGVLVDLRNEAKASGKNPVVLIPKQKGEYGKFVRAALDDGETPETCELALSWLVAKASGELPGSPKAWAYFGTALDAVKAGWKKDSKGVSTIRERREYDKHDSVRDADDIAEVDRLMREAGIAV